MAVAITNAYIVPIEAEPFTGSLVIEDGVITALGENVEIPAAAEVVDAQGQWLLPGLVEAHCHVGTWEEAEGWAGMDVNETTAAVTAGVRAMDAINPADLAFEEARAGGVTTINVLPGSSNVIGGLSVALTTHGDCVDDMLLKQPTGIKSALGENPKRTHGEQKRAPASRLGVAQVLREAVYKAKDYLAAREADPKTPYDMNSEHIGMALRGEIPWRQHCHRTDDISTGLRLAKEFGYNLVIDHGTEAHLIADKVAAANVPVLIGPMIICRPKVELRHRNPAAPGILDRAGAEVTIITDHPIVPIDYLIMQAAIAHKEGMDRDAALRAVTINPAKVLGLDDQLGSLAVGKRADCVLWSGDPLMVASRALRTYVGGELAFEYITPDYMSTDA